MRRRAGRGLFLFVFRLLNAPSHELPTRLNSRQGRVVGDTFHFSLTSAS